MKLSYETNDTGFFIYWSDDRYGFGEIAFWPDADGERMEINTETMGKDFVIQVLTEMIKQAKTDTNEY